MLPGLNNTSQNDQLISQYADRSGGIIDGYVGTWYDISLWTTAAGTPQMVLQISDALTAQMTMRSLFTRDGQNKNDWIKEIAEQAIKDLEGIKKREIRLYDSSGSEATRRASGNFVTSTRAAYKPVFDMDSDLSWKIDTDLLDKISGDRK